MPLKPGLLLILACIGLSNAKSQQIANGLYVYTGPSAGGMGNKMDTAGSRLLLNVWAKGIIINQNDSLINDTALLLNYDKLNNQLLVTRDMQAFLHVGIDAVKAFTLFTPLGNLAFYWVPEISNDYFFQLLSTGGTCTVYKKITTKVNRPDYHTNGLVEYGNKYAEYIDFGCYYIVNLTGKSKFSAKFYSTKSSIKRAFGFDQDKLQRYFDNHKNSPVDDDFVKGIADYFNQ